MDPSPHVNPRIPLGTAIHPIAADCFTCPKDIQPLISDLTCTLTKPICGPLFSGYIDYLKNNLTDTLLTSLLSVIVPSTSDDIQVMVCTVTVN